MEINTQNLLLKSRKSVDFRYGASGGIMSMGHTILFHTSFFFVKITDKAQAITRMS